MKAKGGPAPDRPIPLGTQKKLSRSEGQRAAFSPLGLAYFRNHAIELEVAAGVGVYEQKGKLVYPYANSDGSGFERRRPLDGDRTYQPSGVGLRLWWPAGPPKDGLVLVCEGESDALAALSAQPVAGYAGGYLGVGAVPGTGYPTHRLARELSEAGIEEALLAFDGDEPGRAYTRSARAALREVGIAPIPLHLPDGYDLADCLVEADDRNERLANMISDAEASTDEFTEPEVSPPPEVRTSWSPVLLDVLLDGGALEEPPSLLPRSDGSRLLYAGKLHTVQGEPESGKGWLALRASADQLAAGEHIVYIDFEDGPATIVARLLALGADREAIRERFHYVRPDEPLGDKALADVEALVGLGPSLVVLDGVTEALAQQGLDLRDNLDIAKWIDLLPRRLVRAGIAVVQLDHVVKDKNGRGRFAIGAQHKLAGVDVAYTLEVESPFGRGRTGSAKLSVAKDRPGFVRQYAEGGKRVADLRLISPKDGGVELSLEPPATAGEFRPTGQMERISRVIESNPGLSKNGVRGLIQGKNEVKDVALELLVAEDYVERRTDGQAHRHYSLHPYREDAA
jgi:hypothetical protein